MTRRSMTMVLDEQVIDDLHAAAARLGVRDDELAEEAIRRFVGSRLLVELWSRARLSPEEADTIAAEELAAHRAGRRAS